MKSAHIDVQATNLIPLLSQRRTEHHAIKIKLIPALWTF
ncbi:hypothetical protein SPBRAN_1893 [uncultured Candidatus Thioglobus sp.]|nr:hypothetical protein SPBRAN_1893 [uncultured Candidatus Thioglobus sp.]